MKHLFILAPALALTACATLKNELQQGSGKPITPDYALTFPSIDKFINTALDNTTKINGDTLPLTPDRLDGRIWKSYFSPQSKDPHPHMEKPALDLAVYCAAYGGTLKHTFNPDHQALYQKVMDEPRIKPDRYNGQAYQRQQETQDIIEYIFSHKAVGVFDCTGSTDPSKNWRVSVDSAGLILGDMKDAFRLHMVFFRIRHIKLT